jgi:hypothetical protein
MIETIQKLLPWITTLPFAAKMPLSIALVMITGAILVLIWTPSKPASPSLSEELPNNEVARNYKDPTQQQKNKPQEETNMRQIQPPTIIMWPQEKTLDALKQRIERVSQMNRNILRELAHSGRNGLYAGNIQDKFKLSRHEVISRGKELQDSQLIEILDLTDKNYRINNDVWQVIGPNRTDLLETLLR